MIGPVLQFDDLQRISGYTRAADVERWATSIGLKVKPSREGVWTTANALDAALGIAANADKYAADAVI